MVSGNDYSSIYALHDVMMTSFHMKDLGFTDLIPLS